MMVVPLLAFMTELKAQSAMEVNCIQRSEFDHFLVIEAMRKLLNISPRAFSHYHPRMIRNGITSESMYPLRSEIHLNRATRVNQTT